MIFKGLKWLFYLEKMVCPAEYSQSITSSPAPAAKLCLVIHHDRTDKYWLSIKKSIVTHLALMFPVPQTQQPSLSPSGQLCSRNVMLDLRWSPWGRQSAIWRRWSRPSHSSTLWAGRRRTELSRRQSGSAWCSRSRTAASPHRSPPRRHLLWGEIGGKKGRQKSD